MADVENLRYEAGKDARAKGESLHDNASEEYRRGYSRGSGLGTNVMPKKFGIGARPVGTWTCVCGHVNKNNIVAKREGNIVCWKCGVQKDYGEDRDNG